MIVPKYIDPVSSTYFLSLRECIRSVNIQPVVTERAVTSYSKDTDKRASRPAIEPRAATIGLPAEAEAPLTLALSCGDDVAETVAAADPIVALGTGPFEPFSAIAAAESSANPIERGW